jgi:hypothetical protein
VTIRELLAGSRRSAPGLCVLLAVAAMAVGFAVGLPGAASGAGYWHTCKPPSSLPIGTLRAHRVACGKARRIIADFYAKAQAEGPDVTVAGFHCVGIVGGASCRHGAKRIRLDGSSERIELPTRVVERSESCPDAGAPELPADRQGVVAAACVRTVGAGNVALHPKKCANVTAEGITGYKVEISRTLGCPGAKRVMRTYFRTVVASAHGDGDCADKRSTKGCEIEGFRCTTRYEPSAETQAGECRGPKGVAYFFESDRELVD